MPCNVFPASQPDNSTRSKNFAERIQKWPSHEASHMSHTAVRPLQCPCQDKYCVVASPPKVYSHRHSLGHQYNCRQLIIVLFASPLIVIFFSNAGSGKYHLRLLLILKYTVHIFPPGSVVSRLKK